MSNILKGLNEGRSYGRDSWDSNMPGYQGDYGGAENFGRRNREWDEDDRIDARIRAEYEKKKEYEQNGKFWLKLKDSQRHLPAGPFIGKQAANTAAVELLKQQPELKGNLVITAYGPDETQGVAEGSAFDKWADDRAASQLYKLKPATEWTVSYDYGPHQSETVKVKARSAQEAVDKVETAAEKKGRSIMVNWARPAEQGQLDELSNKTLASYKKKAGADATQADKRGDYARGNKRMSGIIKATKKEFDNDAKGLAEGSEELYGLRVGDTVKAVINGKRVQGDVIDIFPETMEVELLLRGANAGRTVTVDVRDTEAVTEAFGSTSVDIQPNAGGAVDGHQQAIDFYNQEVDRLAGQADPEFQEWIEAAEEKLVAAVRAGKPYTHLAKVLSAQQVKKFGGKTLGQTNYGDRFSGTEAAYYTPEIRDIIAGPVTNAGNEMTRRHELSLQLQTIRSGWRRMSPEDKQNLADQVGYSIEELEHFVKTGQHPDEENDLREMSSFGNQSMKKVRPATPDELRTGYTASKSHAVGADGNVYYFMDPKLKQVGLLRNKQQSVAEEKQRLDPSCWKGYKKQGTKMKGDTRVNNCVPVKKESAIMKGLVDEDSQGDK